MTLSFVDLNQVLPTLLSNSSLAELQRLLDCSLNPNLVFEQIIKSKRYDSLPLFLPLLRIHENKQYGEELCKIFVRAIVDKDLEVIKQFQCFEDILDQKRVAFHYGQLTASSDLPVKYKNDKRSYKEYLIGLISVDNLELFLLAEIKKTELAYIYFAAGECCAKRILDHFGYTERRIVYYVQGALERYNKETITFLFENVQNTEHILEVIKDEIMYGNEPELSPLLVDFVHWLFSQGYLKFTEENWLELKEENTSFYKALQSDV